MKDAADCLRLTAQDMADLGVVEQVFPEDKDFAETYRQIQEGVGAPAARAAGPARGRAAGEALPAVPEILT